MKQEKNIDYFQIEGTPGGNQEWCTDFWMYLGGCGALAACDLPGEKLWSEKMLSRRCIKSH